MRRALFLRERAAKRSGRFLQHIEGTLAGGKRLALAGGGNACLEHHRIARRLLAGKGEIGLAESIESRERRRHAVVPRHVEARGEALEAALGDLGEEGVAIAEVAVRRGRADAGEPRRFGQAEAERAVLLDQLARRLEQHLFEVAVMIGSWPAPAGPI